MHRGIAVTILGELPQVMPPLDPDLVSPVMAQLLEGGVAPHTGDGLVA